LIRFDNRTALRLAAVTALAALALGGCGRKGPLDPPPSAAIAPDTPSLGDANDPNMTGYRRPPPGTVTAQPGGPLPRDNRTFILDPLIK
jgi:predicted small lipoprotein YifL